MGLAGGRAASKGSNPLPDNATGLTEGAFLSVTVSKKRTTVGPGTIILAPQEMSNRPWTEAEWRGAIAEGLADVKAGRLLGPYKGAGELIAAMRKDLKDLKKERRRK